MKTWPNSLIFASKNLSSLYGQLLWLFYLFILNNLILLILYWLKISPVQSNVVIYSQSFSFAVIILLMLYVKHLKVSANSFSDTSSLKKETKYEKTGLSKSFSLELKYQLEFLIHKEKLYLEHDLKLDDIAQLLDISRHHASQVINENYQMNFYDFINSHRIEYAKKKLNTTKNRKKSIEDLAFECGFNNRVSFYNAFRKVTKTTPTKFVKKNLRGH